MKWMLVLVAAVALGAAACGGEGQSTGLNAPPATFTATEEQALAGGMVAALRSQKEAHGIIDAADHGGVAVPGDIRVGFEKTQDLILEVCLGTSQIADRDWKVVVSAACSELGPFMLMYQPERYDGAILILQDALEHGP